MIPEMIFAQYYAFVVLAFIVSTLAAMAVAAIDATYGQMVGRPVPQH
jgi:hypothetical protein